MSAFDRAFTLLIQHEGAYTDNPADAGNYTGGKVGVGELKGTMYGVSAAAYPNLDIKSLSLDDCKAIYKRDYWDKIDGDTLDPGLALVVFDAAVNNGVGRAIRWLQAAVGVVADGVIGEQTREAIARADPQATLVDVHGQRMHHMAGLPTWQTFGRGWSRRLASLPYQAAGMGDKGNG